MFDNHKGGISMNNSMNLALTRFAEAKTLLETFATKETAVEYLVHETGISKDECAKACDVLIRLDSSRAPQD